MGNPQYPHCPEIESQRRAHFPWVNRVTEVDEDTTAYHVEVGGVDLDVELLTVTEVDQDMYNRPSCCIVIWKHLEVIESFQKAEEQ